MNKLPMSRAASALLRELLARNGAESDRILLSEIRSTEWQSLTFAGERHRITLRVAGPEAESIVLSLTSGIEEAKFLIPGQIVADIAVAGEPLRAADNSLTVSIEALTIAE